MKPETSKSFTAGAVFEPVKNWTLALDYFKIERKDEIGTRTTADLLKGEATLPAGQLIRVDNTAADSEFLSLVSKYAPGNTTNFGDVGKLGLAYNPYVNTGKTRVSGLDFDAAGRFMVAAADVRLKLEGTYNMKYQVFSVAENGYGDNLAGDYDHESRLRMKFRTVVVMGAWDNGLTFNYRSGYSNNSEDSPTYCVTQKVAEQYMDTCGHVGSNTTVDYNLAYSGIKNVKLRVFVDNIFNQEAPVKWREGYTPQFRMLGASASYSF